MKILETQTVQVYLFFFLFFKPPHCALERPLKGHLSTVLSFLLFMAEFRETLPRVNWAP